MANRYRGENGVSMISAVAVIPLALTVAAMLVDLGRIYLTTLYAKEVALFTARAARSSDPHTSVPADTTVLIKLEQGEPFSATMKRKSYWNDLLDDSSQYYHGLNYFTDKELKVFNLGYGFAVTLNPDVLFPIPQPVESVDELAGRINCTIRYDFVVAPDPLDLTKNHDRIYFCECAVPLFGLRLLNFATGTDHMTVTQTAYAYQSGTIKP